VPIQSFVTTRYCRSEITKSRYMYHRIFMFLALQYKTDERCYDRFSQFTRENENQNKPSWPPRQIAFLNRLIVIRVTILLWNIIIQCNNIINCIFRFARFAWRSARSVRRAMGHGVPLGVDMAAGSMSRRNYHSTIIAGNDQ